MTAKKAPLKRGLGSLLTATQPLEAANTETTKDGGVKELAIEHVYRSPFQPRRVFDEQAIEELAASIQAQGLMQPVVVRKTEKGYELIAGERRWRATQQLQLPTIPAIIKEVDDEAAIAMALIENIQREDLNAMEQASALARLKEAYELTHAEVAEAVGKNRATVTNLLRLLSLDTRVQKLLENGDLEMGHARALLGLKEGAKQYQAAETIITKRLSVRQAEELIRSLATQSTKPTKTKSEDPDVRALIDSLSERIGVPVDIKAGSGGKGKLVLSYSSLDELDGILSRIK